MTVIESGPSIAGRFLTHTTRMTVRTALQVGSHAATIPWPYGAIEFFAGLAPKTPGSRRTTIYLPNTTAELIRAPGVTHNTGRVILYLHGGGFLMCGPNTHGALVTQLSKVSNSPVLAVNYRMIPNSLGAAIEDCLDGYDWLRRHYSPEQIVLAGDSAGGYLALATATHLDETPAAMVLMSPLLQLDPAPKKRHPNIRCDAMFGPEAFDALAFLIRRANGGLLYEPLDDLTADLPPTLIHASGHEVLLHDTYLAKERLENLGVPVEVRVWPGQIHVFQIAHHILPEARRSLDQIGGFVRAKTSQVSCVKWLTDRTATVG